MSHNGSPYDLIRVIHVATYARIARVAIITSFQPPLQPGSAVNSFTDQGKFVAMKTLSGLRAPRCDNRQFRDEMTVST